MIIKLSSILDKWLIASLCNEIWKAHCCCYYYCYSSDWMLFIVFFCKML